MPDSMEPELQWDDEALEILEANTPHELRDQLRAEIAHFARSRGDDRVSLDTFLALQELLHGS